MNESSLGFARGMNEGLAIARGRYVAFCNNDAVLPPDWASRLLQSARCHPNAAIVVPAVSAARNPVNVRAEPGVDVEVLPPFSAPPAAIIYVMPADVVRRAGAWGEEYEIASGEGVDRAVQVWGNGL